jgi:hypothetical protein
LGEVKEHEAFDEQLRLGEGVLRREIGLIVAQVSLDFADVPVELFEELVGKGLFVEGFVADVAELERADVLAGVKVKLGETFGSGAVAFAWADAEAAKNEAPVYVVPGGGAAEFGVDDMEASAAVSGQRIAVSKQEQRGGKTLAKLLDECPLEGATEGREFGVNDGEAAAGHVSVSRKNLKALIGGDSRDFAFAPSFFVV